MGANQALTVHVRVLAATNRDLAQMMQQGTFREDLFYRLNVIALDLPPLRERREDILILAEHFLAQFGARQGRPLRLSAEVVERLLRYPWPGNVRELANAMEHTAILTPHDVITPDDLPPHIAAGMPLGPAPALQRAQTLADLEKVHILQTLEHYGWNHSRAAEILGINRSSLWRKLKEYQLADGLEHPTHRHAAPTDWRPQRGSVHTPQ